MNSVDIIILVMVVILVYYMLRKPSEQFANNNSVADSQPEKVTKRHKKHKGYDKYLDTIANEYECQMLNGDLDMQFVEMQFHTDYRDTLSAFNGMSNNRQLFNPTDKPITTSSPKKNKVNKLVKSFIKELNKKIMNDVPSTLNPSSGWDEVMPQDKVKSGWEKQMESLGLPASIYNEPAKKAKLQLLKIDEYYSLETEDDVRIVCYLICKKKNVHDQIILKVNFWLDKRDINGDRQFFKDKNDEDTDEISVDEELDVVIEEIFVVGYLTGNRDYDGMDKGARKNFYHFENIEKDGMMDQQEILRQLRQKQRDRAIETGNRIGNLDKENQMLYEQTPHLTNYESYQNTRTIFDDVECKKAFSTFNNDF